MAQRTALVIGTSSGISHAVARRLVTDGHRVAITYSEEAPPEFFSVHCDLAQVDTIESAFGEVESGLGPVGILVVDAGVPREPRLPGPAATDLSHATRVGLRAVSAAANRARESMKQAEWGRMIFLASPLAMVDETGPARYAGFSFNAGLNGLVQSLTEELAADNIAVNVVAPGLIEGDEKVQLSPGIRTHPMWHIPAHRAGRPAEVAAAVSFFADDRSGYVNGTTLRVDGGIGIRTGMNNRL
ncbi:SDR family NAD(P)-dependent oxidoreductase [Actinoplanes sp. ATCC 53533]|uniref:SDR family NAD(P)-dependent oxidoreductase n=1 Tax=Actinoplanes sp. ATCC 53533 TaxID=1288362 RepID=UPI000F79F5DC|nr:SDR family oxidoreductase [Actinoplanes sp. ATCC 53533]